MTRTMLRLFQQVTGRFALALTAKRKVRNTRAHYLKHREYTRTLVGELIRIANAHYLLVYGRVAIRDQRRRWGSCSKKGNLNFNYRLLFLPRHLAEYVVVHELCHLIVFNHSKSFWKKVEEVVPDHRVRRAELRALARTLMR